MSIQSLRSFERKESAAQALPERALTAAESDRSIAMALLRNGAISGHDMMQALAQVQAGGGRLVDALLAAGGHRQEQICTALGDLLGLGVADLRRWPADPRLIDRLGATYCMAHHVLPWRDGGGTVVIATPSAEVFQQHFVKLLAVFGPVTHVLAPAGRIEAALLNLRGPQMAQGAESLLPLKHSCRAFRPASRLTMTLLAALAALCLVALPLAMTVLLLWASFTLIATAVMKLAAMLSTLRTPVQESGKVVVARLPVVSVMVGLYKESDIAARLVRRLGQLDYPRDKLDVVLVCEEEDLLTRNALRAADLPSWMRVVVAPRGRVKTKPRALNFGLTQCKGSIVGVYDAEDAPEPDQIRKVVERFHQRGPDVACLQGVLDFYNPHRNWLSRCFTIEYAAWFRVILPGLERLGLPLPLGGTTLFFRREALEKLGGWDAHNVTEDADLGMRLVRQGYRTELIRTTTFEEANCLALPWIKQRSRWVKGYMMTYITHMRTPRLMWRQMGTKAFLGFQVLFLGSLTQTLLAPLLWSMLELHFGLGHPVSAWLDHGTITALSLLFVGAEVLNFATGIIGLARSGQKISWMWVLTLTFYFPLQALAGYKALWELLHVPFYWDKDDPRRLVRAERLKPGAAVRAERPYRGQAGLQPQQDEPFSPGWQRRLTAL